MADPSSGVLFLDELPDFKRGFLWKPCAVMKEFPYFRIRCLSDAQVNLKLI